MKTGILTFHYAHHYGAQLQAYALMKAITNLGMECEIINYVRRDNIEGSSLFKKGLSAGTLLSNANTLLNYGGLKKRQNRFNSFVNKEMKLSDKFYASYGELAADKPAYDIYVCGSDQIWNPLIFSERTFDPAFFADFAASGKKVAYAPSFGISIIPEDRRELLKDYLSKFDCLSVREKQGEKIIRDIAGRDAKTVLDPTLLLTGEEWGAYSTEPGFKDPYILCYFITDARKYGDLINAVEKKYNMPVVSLCGTRRVVPQTKHTVLDAGPKEFLGLFKNASLVCTDSFHGTVFSINFNREFFCFDSTDDPKKAVNSRLQSILGRLGLSSRLFSYRTEAEEFKKCIRSDLQPIDYKHVKSMLDSEREQSIAYLETSLGLL